MTGEIFKRNTRSTEKNWQRRMEEECSRFGKLVALKVNRDKETSLTLAENADKFPWLMSQAVQMILNDNPFQMHAAVNLLIGQRVKENLLNMEVVREEK